MAFIFTPEGDPRRETVSETFKADQTVKYRGMTMPATIISGPHKTHGEVSRWLIRKADDTVALVPEAHLSAVMGQRERVAKAVFEHFNGMSWARVSTMNKNSYLSMADKVLAAIDAEAKSKPGPLAEGDRIRILKRQLSGAVVEAGDILPVLLADNGDGYLRAKAPKAMMSRGYWLFPKSAEGTGWERV